VNKVSTLRKLGVAARVAGNQAGRNRTVNALGGAVRAGARSFGRVLHQLWLEITGVLFFTLALSGLGATVREYGKYHTGQASMGRVVLAVCFTLTFAWFGMSSFWRVRRKTKAVR
jgi:hypothetical protein